MRCLRGIDRRKDGLMTEWPECEIDPKEQLPEGDPWLLWALKLTMSVPDGTAYETAQTVAKALRAAYWRGQAECGCEDR